MAATVTARSTARLRQAETVAVAAMARSYIGGLFLCAALAGSQAEA